MKTSTVSGAVAVRKMREKNIFGKTREQMARGKSERQKKTIYKNMQQMYNTIWSAYHKYRELKNQDAHAYYEDSMQVLQLLGQNVTSGAGEDTAIQNTLADMTESYEQQQKEYSDLFGDDFTDFGNFNV